MRKSEKYGYVSYILHLAPYTLAGMGNVCPNATAGCAEACLNTSGHGGMFRPGEDTNQVQEARKRRTRWFFQDRQGFLDALVDDIAKAIRQARRKDMIPVFRLNGTSDLCWESYKIKSQNNKNIFEVFPDIQFYDYTKILNRRVANISNYHLTFSRAESNEHETHQALSMGMNVAVVFKNVPDVWQNKQVINGDLNDLRFLDKSNVIVGLKAKGRARRDTSGFVVNE